MSYYHIAITKKDGENKFVFSFDMGKQQVLDGIILPLQRQKSFMVSTFLINPFNVESIVIAETKEKASDILSKQKRSLKRTTYKLLGYENDTTIYANEWYIIKAGKDVTEDLIRNAKSIFDYEEVNQNTVVKEVNIQTNHKDMVEWNKLNNKIRSLESDITQFEVEFINRDEFKNICDNLSYNLKNLKNICITGYFSETIRMELEKMATDEFHLVHLISPDFTVGTPRDKKNVEALRKLSQAGVQIKFNSRLHARLLVAYNSISSLLILGSFDYNTECIGKERYDAGVKTNHPDLAKSAITFFQQIWNDSETQSLEEFLRDKKIK